MIGSTGCFVFLGIFVNHSQLFQIVKKLPEDYEPYGNEVRWADDDKTYPDCSWGCKYAVPLEGALGYDWVICSNPDSHRAGLLTFEHQGCFKFEEDDDDV